MKVLVLIPAWPFRTKKTMPEGIELWEKNDQLVPPTHAFPMWTLKMEGHYLVSVMRDKGFKTRSQHLPLNYVVNGC